MYLKFNRFSKLLQSVSVFPNSKNVPSSRNELEQEYASNNYSYKSVLQYTFAKSDHLNKLASTLPIKAVCTPEVRSACLVNNAAISEHKVGMIDCMCCNHYLHLLLYKQETK